MSEDKFLSDDEKCSVLETLHLLGKKWVAFILSELVATPRLSFTDLLQRVKGLDGRPISSRVLSHTLRELEDEHIVERSVRPDTKPIRVEYALTEKGDDLIVVLSVLKSWGAKWGGVPVKRCRTFTCLHDAIPICDLDKVVDELYFIAKTGDKISFTSM